MEKGKTIQITMEDIREWKKQLDEAAINPRNVHIEITEHNSLYYRISGSVHGLVLKETWDRLLKEAVEK